MFSYKQYCKETVTFGFLCTDEDLNSHLQDKRASGFQRFYHVTDPFIKRLGLEAELQVTDDGGFLFIFIFISFK